jgi:hypothetical protein
MKKKTTPKLKGFTSKSALRKSPPMQIISSEKVSNLCVASNRKDRLNRLHDIMQKYSATPVNNLQEEAGLKKNPQAAIRPTH